MAAITKSLCFSFILLASFATLFTVTDARRFYVGGNGVWVINPQENYNTWAGRNRFQVNDTLYFKYQKGSDSVQEVMKADFDGCNIRNPLKNFDDGESVVMLNRSGPFYFISGNQDHCIKGQKLIVVVLAIRNQTTAPISPAKPPSSAQPPKTPSPVSPPLAPAKSPKSHSPVSPIAPASSPSKSQPPKSSVSPTQSPSPVSHSPAVSPSHAPSIAPKAPSPSPKSHAPSMSPKAPSPSPSPKAPSPSPSPKSVSPSPSPSPATSEPPKLSPSMTPSPNTTPTSDNITSPAPAPSHKNSAIGVTVNSVMTTVLSVALTVLMFA